MKALIGIVMVLLTVSQPGYALRQYRCSGRIQYHPCSMELPTGERHSSPTKLKNSVPIAPGGTTSSKPFVEILSISFSKINNQRGLWRGRLRGHGTIEPELQIFRGSELESSRAMGAVVLLEQETPFTFNSALPTGSDWSWRIVAQAH
jgi:hypothetical protein